MYRPWEWRKVERSKEMRARKSNWFKGPKRKTQTLIFVHAIPRGAQKTIHGDIERAKVKLAVAQVLEK